MIIIILIFGFIYRLIGLSQSLWLDEAITAQTIERFSFWQLITEFPNFDLHPPGHYLLLWLWRHVAGYSEIALRIPSVFFGVGTIYLAYLLGTLIGNKKNGLVAAWFLAINPLHLYYSQEARMYGMATFAVLLNYYFFQKILRGKFSWGYVVSAMLIVVSDYVAYFSFLGQFVVICWWHRDRLKSWLVGIIPSGILFGLWSPIFLTQLRGGSEVAKELPVWQKVVGGFDLKALGLVGVKTMFGRISIENKLWYGGAVVLGGLLYARVLARAVLREWEQSKEILVMIMVPVLSAWLGSLILPIFSFFRVLFVVPFVMILLAIGISNWKKWGALAVIGLSLVSLLSGSYYLLSGKFQREDWRSMVWYLDRNKSADSAVVFESNGSFAPFDYYNVSQIKTIYGLKRIPAKTNEDISVEVNKLHRIFLVEYLFDITDPNRLLIKNLVNNGWVEVKVDDFRGVGFVREWIK